MASQKAGPLLISESKARYASLDAAQERALADYAASSQPGDSWVSRSADEHWIPLLERLPRSLAGHVAELRPPPTSLRDLARSGRCWRMAVEGPDAESTLIVVDNNYDLSTVEDCAKPLRPVSHLKILPFSETSQQAPALRNNQPATIEAHSAQVQVNFPDGQTGRMYLLMLYDPASRLFWWEYSLLNPTQPDSVAESENHSFLSGTFFIAKDRIAAFYSTSVLESTERYANFQTARSHLFSALERMRGSIQGNSGLPIRYLDISGIPRDFFRQCGHAEMGVVQLKRVTKANGSWRLDLSGANGNSAVLFLKDNYETAGVQLSPEPPPDAIERVVRSETIAEQQSGGTANLNLRELQIRHSSECNGSNVTRVALIFDPSTPLSWWRTLNSDGAFTPAVVEAEGMIVVFSTAMPRIEVTESSERYADWGDFQSHLLKSFGQGPPMRYLVVDLRNHVPDEFLQPSPSGSASTSAPQVSRTKPDGNWLWLGPTHKPPSSSSTASISLSGPRYSLSSRKSRGRSERKSSLRRRS